jgi:hypothetical protein
MNVLRMPGRCSMVFDDAATTNTTVNFKKYKIPVRMAGREILDKLFDRCYACKIKTPFRKFEHEPTETMRSCF